MNKKFRKLDAKNAENFFGFKLINQILNTFYWW